LEWSVAERWCALALRSHTFWRGRRSSVIAHVREQLLVLLGEVPAPNPSCIRPEFRMGRIHLVLELLDCLDQQHLIPLRLRVGAQVLGDLRSLHSALLGLCKSHTSHLLLVVKLHLTHGLLHCTLLHSRSDADR